jgi:uncharacterized membrane protein
MISKPATGLHLIGRYFSLCSMALISIGVILLFFNRSKIKVNKEFLILIFVWFLYALAGMAVPNFGNALNVTRLYHLTLIFLAPCLIVSFRFFSKFISKRKMFQSRKINTFTVLISSFLILNFLFSSGMIYSLSNDPPYSWYIDERSNGGPKWEESEFISSNWLNSVFNKEFIIYSDTDNFPIFRIYNLYEQGYARYFKNPKENLTEPNILFFSGKRNLIDKEIQILPQGFGSVINIPIENFSYYHENFARYDLIYCSKISKIKYIGAIKE